MGSRRMPRHSGTGRVRMLGISKRDTYSAAIHGARSVRNVAAVALANKTARTIWALLAHDRTVPAELRQSARLGKTGTEITYHQEEVSRQEVAQGTTKCDGEQVRPRSAKPEQAQGQEAQWENEARIG